ncbi:hypothetical protein [Kolpuevirus frurule]|uniref:Uncharacterized protein n=1 Tax=Kolpuevirus sp. 'frurule' TaxID=3028514 RepID=A0AAF0IQS2_9CAUD|nr:hypothetical protein [Kolpuevirus sp. 'frurule']
MASLVIGSKFRPFSYSEMLAPIEAATTEHRAIEEGLGEMSAKAGMWDKLANQQSDPVAYAQYKTYADDLTKQADLLARQGLTPESRRGLLDMKRRYSNEITPIEVAATKREELTKAQREAIQKDPSLMFNIDYGTASLDDLINNPNATYNTISGSELSKRASMMASNLAKTIQENPQYQSILGGQYFQQMQQLGYTPQQVMQTIMNDPNAPSELKQVADTVWQEAGLDTWDQATQTRARDYINAGLYDAIGTQKFDTQGNRAFMSPAESARLEMDRERFELAKAQAAKDKTTIPLQDGSTIRVIGGGKALRIYPDGRVENYVGNSGIAGAGVKDAAKRGDTPIIIANTRGKWRTGEEGKDVKGTLFGMTRSEAVSGWGNYTLDNVKPSDIVTNYNEIPKGALDEMLKTAKDKNIDLDYYDVVRVKADKSRAVGDYDYVLMPKQSTSQLPMATPVTPQVTGSINFDENMGL